MKIKDAREDQNLVGVRIQLPDGSIKHIYSFWQKGLWCKIKMTDSRIYPYFFDSLEQILELDLVD